MSHIIKRTSFFHCMSGKTMLCREIQLRCGCRLIWNIHVNPASFFEELGIVYKQRILSGVYAAVQQARAAHGHPLPQPALRCAVFAGLIQSWSFIPVFNKCSSAWYWSKFCNQHINIPTYVKIPGRISRTESDRMKSVLYEAGFTPFRWYETTLIELAQDVCPGWEQTRGKLSWSGMLCHW